MTARLELGIKRESAVQLASFLVTNGLITEDQLEQAVVSSDESNRGLVETILEFGVVSEEEIATSIGTMYNLEKAYLRRDDDISLEALSLLPVPFIQQNRIVPFAEDSGMIKVAISEPNALNTVPSVRTITNKKVTAYVVTFAEMQSVLARFDPAIDEPANKQQPPALRSVKQSEVKRTAATAKDTTKSKDGDKEAVRLTSEVVKLVDEIMANAMSGGEPRGSKGIA